MNENEFTAEPQEQSIKECNCNHNQIIITVTGIHGVILPGSFKEKQAVVPGQYSADSSMGPL